MKPVDSETLKTIEESVKVCRDAARLKLNAVLELDEVSILKLDALISSAWPSGVPSASTMQVFGSYLGEGMRKELSGTWVQTPAGLGVAVHGVVAHPFNKIEKRFRLGIAESVSFFYNSFKTAVRAASVRT
jgi:hypothetical protein